MTDHNDSRTAIQTHSSSQGKSSVDRGSGLMRCLSLVRPVGMNDDAASDWLAVAMVEVRELSDTAFEAGCRNARETATHHGQIIPAILKGAREFKPDFASKFASEWDAMVRGSQQQQIGGAKPIGKLIEGARD